MDKAHSELEQAYTSVRLGLVKALRSQGIDSLSGTAISNRLGLNRQLAWQLSSIAQETSPAVGLALIPGERSLKLLVETVSKTGTTHDLGPRGAIQELQQAIDRLELVIRTHAGDRATLGLLAATWDSAELQTRTETLRRDGHRAQCALLGSRVETQIRGMIYAPSRQGRSDQLALATYACFRGITRIRAGHRTRISAGQLPVHDDGTPTMTPEEYRATLMERFRVEPDLSTAQQDDIEINVDKSIATVSLKPGQVGHAAATTVVCSGCPRTEQVRYAGPRDQVNKIVIQCQIPIETVIVDCWMDRRLKESETFVSSLRGQCYDATTLAGFRALSHQDPTFLFDVTDVEPLNIEHLGADSAFDQMAELVSRTAQRGGTSLEHLLGVRFRVKYIMSPMCLVIERPLAQAPQ